MPQPLNILWIYLEDVSPWFGCYGDSLARTPFLDSLAEEGLLFERCYTTSPVCSPARSSLITGAWPSRLGMQHHRSSRTAVDRNYLGRGFKTLPERFQTQGYLTFNFGKDDYNFQYDREALYPGPYKSHFHWKESANQPDWHLIPRMAPFFGQIQLLGGKRSREEVITSMSPGPETVSVPAFYPDEPEFRDRISRHYGCIEYLDREVRGIFHQLESNDLRKNTVVFIFSDHGCDGLRDKQFCYEGGTHIPLIVVGPDGSGFEAGSRRTSLFSSLDISATTCAIAGINDDIGHDGIDMRDPASGRNHVVSQRDRCDYTLDCIRSVVSERFRYIQNLCPDRPWLQSQYRSDWVEFNRWKQLARQTNADTPSLRFARNDRPVEELYDLFADHDQVENLASDPAHAQELKRHREWLCQWRHDVDDPGPVFPENQLLASLLRWGTERCDHPAYVPVREKYFDEINISYQS